MNFSSENFQITIQQQLTAAKEEEEEEESPHTKEERNMASRLGPKFGKVAVHNFPLSYYYKVATASFVCGGIFEAVMIHT
jgi:hypothetical protein|tara:strand:- start:113 stop:352 length:240 start_codon:yes stop_codon:yes gene_type:complete